MQVRSVIASKKPQAVAGNHFAKRQQQQQEEEEQRWAPIASLGPLKAVLQVKWLQACVCAGKCVCVQTSVCLCVCVCSPAY